MIISQRKFPYDHDDLLPKRRSHNGREKRATAQIPHVSKFIALYIFKGISMESRKTRNENWGAKREGSEFSRGGGTTTEVILPSPDRAAERRDDFVASCRRLMGL